jgi:hypothetical protein
MDRVCIEHGPAKVGMPNWQGQGFKNYDELKLRPNWQIYPFIFMEIQRYFILLHKNDN